MAEQMISCNSGKHSGSKPGNCIKGLSCRYVKHDQIYHEKDQCGSEISREHKNQYVSGGNSSCYYNILKFFRFVQACRYIKYKQNLDKFRGLDIKSCNLES